MYQLVQLGKEKVEELKRNKHAIIHKSHDYIGRDRKKMTLEKLHE